MQVLNNLCGIDVGCTNIKMTAIVDNVPIYKSIPSGDDFTREQLVNAISDFYLSFDNKFSGLGIAFSGCTTDGQSVCKTTLKCLNNLCVDDFSHLQCPKVRFLNDANASALAGLLEYPDSQVLVSITNGTGIGCGIAINGNLFTGSNGLAGEIYGNPIILPDGNFSKVGKFCSGSKILKKITNPDSEFRKEEIIKEASPYMGCVLVSLIHSYNPDVIYFSGGGFNYPGYLEQTLDFVYEHTYPQFLKNLTFAHSTFSTYSGCFGAMKYLLE